MMDQRQTRGSGEKSPAEVFAEMTSRHFADQEISREDCLRALMPFLNGEVALSETKGGHSDDIIADAAKFLTTADLRMIRDLALARLVEDLRDNDGENDQFFSEMARAAARQLEAKHEETSAEEEAPESIEEPEEMTIAELFGETAHAAEMRGIELSKEECFQVLVPYLIGEEDPSEINYGDPYDIVKGAALALSVADLRMIRDLALARLDDDLREGEGENSQFFTQMAKAASYYFQKRVGKAPDKEQNSGLSQLRGPQI